MSFRKLIDAQVEEILRRYQEGERARTLGEEFGVHEKTVLVYVRLNKDRGEGDKVIRTENPRRRPHFKATFDYNTERYFDNMDQMRRKSDWSELNN